MQSRPLQPTTLSRCSLIYGGHFALTFVLLRAEWLITPHRLCVIKLSTGIVTTSGIPLLVRHFYGERISMNPAGPIVESSPADFRIEYREKKEEGK